MFVRVLSLRNNYSESMKRYFMKQARNGCNKCEVVEVRGQDEFGAIRISRTVEPIVP